MREDLKHAPRIEYEVPPELLGFRIPDKSGG